MDTNSSKEKVVKYIRKDASRKTVFINRAAYKKTNWYKLKIEKSLVRRGIIDDAGLIVIPGDNPSSPVWELSKYSFLLENPIPFTVNPKL